MKLLTKTDFISYKECPNNVWIKWHKPEEYSKFPISEFEKSLGEMGEGVEEEARKLFPGGFLIEKRSEGAHELTKKLILEKKQVIFQAVFKTEKYFAAADVIKWNEKANAYDIYEVKMSSADGEDGCVGEEKVHKINKKKETQYEYDLGFQTNVAKLSGINFNKKYLIRLNKNYIRNGELDHKRLFEFTDKTEILNETFLSNILTEMESAINFLSNSDLEIKRCPCFYKGRSSHCTTFTLSNFDVPDYSVHDLNRIGNSKKYLSELLNEGVMKIDEVPIDDRLIPKPKKGECEQSKPKKLNQVLVYKNKKPIIDVKSIEKELNSLRYPLYFLDYETSPRAIPVYNGYHPYQHVVFQYSLHIVKDEKSIPEHKECLVFNGDPAKKIVESLRENISDFGTVISWYKSFENSRNKELSKLVPEYSDFLQSMIDRTYDLMDIVEKQYYVHHGFKGSSSIKKIQPVIAPDFSYKDLDVKNGTEAIEAYRQIVSGELNDDEVKYKTKQMLKYCEYDTLIMYKIWKFFVDLVDKNKTTD